MHTVVVAVVPEASSELLQAVFIETESAGVELRDASLKPLPGATPLTPGTVEARAWYGDPEAANEAMALLIENIPDAIARCEAAPDEDWTEKWKTLVRATRAGRVWVGPSWLVSEAGDAPVRVVIDPGMAFGTGDHPTTAMCLEALDEALAAKPGASVLDVGTGSGVLAIAARKLGAGTIVGNDIDRDAVRIAQENAALNHAAGLDITERPVERIAGRFDLVAANLFANVLCLLAPRIVAKTAPGGRLLLSGILVEQAPEVLAAYGREPTRLVERRDRGEWTLLILERV